MIDINCDLGEGFEDKQIIPFITSANIATGFHAGNPLLMADCIELCERHQVHIGAHPSYWDRKNFGRTVQDIPKQELLADLQYQIGALQSMCIARGAQLHHVKPHGALYNQAARDSELSETIIEAILSIDSHLILYALSGSITAKIAKAKGLKVYQEGFADRRYLESGQLVPRCQLKSIFEDIEQSLEQAIRLAQKRPITTIEQQELVITVDTICIHSDHDHASELAKAIHDKLKFSS